MDLGLKGRKALVMGASRGIGYQIAETLASEGAKVGIFARNEAVLQEAADKIRETSGQCAPWSPSCGGKGRDTS